MERIVTAIEIPHLDRAHEYVRKLFSYGRCNRHNQPVGISIALAIHSFDPLWG